MSRVLNGAFITFTLLGSWFAMRAVHELGHVLGAMATGAEVTRVVLWPWTISRTDVVNNTRPLVVAWAGPITKCGLLMHSSVAVTTAGKPLGLTAVKFSTRKKFKGTNALKGGVAGGKHSVNTTRIPIRSGFRLRLKPLLRSSRAAESP